MNASNDFYSDMPATVVVRGSAQYQRNHASHRMSDDIDVEDGLPAQDSLASIVLHTLDYHNAIRCYDSSTLQQDEKGIDLGFPKIVTKRTDHF